MPKIKVKNIPSKKTAGICNTFATIGDCNRCFFALDDGRCKALHKEEIIDLPDKYFPTNREWLESLSSEDLAAFYTHGVLIERYSPYPINLHQIVGNFMSSQQGIEEWLSQPCVYLMEKE